MRMTTCNYGHYYDQEKHASCPYCANINGAAGDATQQTAYAEMDDNEKTSLYRPSDQPQTDDGKTAYLGTETHQENKGVSSEEPILLAGWLAVISELGRGQSYTLTFGLNNIGRSKENHVAIQNGDQSISREKHASIIYDYTNNIFYVKHGEGQFLTYLNGEVLLETRQLKPYDRIRVGVTELMFVPLCGEAFKWED